VDTDQFGTFTGEVARTGAPADAARAKARLAMSVTGLPYGLASEASYGPLPGGGWATRRFCCSATTLRESEIIEGHRTMARRLSRFPYASGQWASRNRRMPSTFSLSDGVGPL